MVFLENMVFQEERDRGVHVVHLVPQEQRGPRETEDQSVFLEILDLRVHQASQEPQVLEVLWVFLETVAGTAAQVHLVQEVFLAHQVVMVSLAHLVFEERRETPENEALLVTQEMEVVRASRGHQVRLETMGTMV